MIFHCDAGHLIEDGDAVALLRPEHVVVLLARGEPVTVVISAVLRSVFVSNTAASPIQVSSPIGCQAKMQSPGWAILTYLIKKLGKHAQQSSQII